MTEIDEDRSLLRDWHELLARHAAVCGALERELQERHGIGVSEFEALERLAAGDKEKYRAQDLTKAMALSQSASSRVVARLERRGLISRGICDQDRRGVFICLTPAGWERYEQARGTHRSVLAATMTVQPDVSDVRDVDLPAARPEAAQPA